MGRGTYEHNYTQLNLPALAESENDRAPSEVTLPPELIGSGPVDVELYCAENLALLNLMTDRWAGRFQLLYLDPPFGSGKVYRARIDGERGRQSQAVDTYRDDQDFHRLTRLRPMPRVRLWRYADAADESG